MDVRGIYSIAVRILDNPCSVGETRSMKLSDSAKQMGVRYETAWRWFRDGKIQGRRIGPHTISISAALKAGRSRSRQLRSA
jgi:hypothetical protein